MLFAVPESFFRILAIGDVKCVLEDTRFPLERNQSGAYVEPSFFARLGDDLDFVAVWHMLSAETCSRTLPEQLSIVRMNNLPHVTHQQFVKGVAEKRFARAIHIKWPPAIMNQNGATAYLGDSAELLFSFAQRMTLLQELTVHRLTAP